MTQLQFTDAAVFLVTLIVGLLALRSHRKAMGPIERQQVGDLPVAELDWQPSRNVFETPEQFGYQVYSQRYDVCVEAADLPAEPGLDDRLKLLDRIERSHAAAKARLANRLREAGVSETMSVAILIDHSGSMNRKVGTEGSRTGRSVVADDSGAALAAGVGLSIAHALEGCGAVVELLGFTTNEWSGGKSLDDWSRAGKPERPGRLNDLMHIIYKRADEPSVDACSHRLEALLRPAFLKENIDGEAIAWARSRLMAQSTPRRLVVYVSDGASVDDSTLMENGPSYLERHLLHVIRDIEKRGDLRIVGVGIGYEMHRYVERSLSIKTSDAFDDQTVDEIAGLIAVGGAS